MALLLVEGWDHLTAAQITAKAWSSTAVTMVTGRFGGQAAHNANGATILSKSFTSSTTVFCGFAMQASAFSVVDFVMLRTGTTKTLQFGINSSGKIEIRNSSGTVIATGTTTLTTATWNYFEIKLVVNGASGSVTVQLNGAAEIAVTTGNFGSTGADNFAFYAHAPSAQTQDIDDIYVLDTTGATNTTFLGDIRVQTLYPTGAGTHTAFTPNGAATNWGCVDEVTADGDTTYVSDATPGDIDSYAMGDVDSSAVVYAVQQTMYARKDDVATRQLAPVIRQGGTDFVGATVTQTSSYVFESRILDQDPTGSNWTAANVNADEAGVKVIA